MNEKVIQNQKKFIDEINDIVDKNRLSHAYFIETNGYPNYMDAVLVFIRKILRDSTSESNYSLINSNFEYPEIRVLNSNGKIIKKESIIELKNECLIKPVLGKYIIYIIDGAENFNASSANTLLKFLEEPEDNIIGILIANNRYQVINTLISRCQILSLVPNVVSFDNQDDVVYFVDQIKNKNKGIFLDNKDKYSWDREQILLFLDKVCSYCLEDTCDIMNMSIVAFIEEKKQQLKYNVNTKLFLDSLVFELIEVISCID